MKLLISATAFEVKPYLSAFNFEQIEENTFKKDDKQVLITGIGLAETAFQLTHFLSSHSVDFILQAGIAGTYQSKIQLGQVVEIIQEQYGDLGAEDAQNFLSVADINLSLPEMFKESALVNEAQFSVLEAVKSISVNSAAGSLNTIKNRKNLFQPDVENMEGLALFRVCKDYAIPFSEVRAISNVVEVRNRDNWQLDKAISNLNDFLINQF